MSARPGLPQRSHKNLPAGDDLAWQAHAACLHHNPDLFFPDKSQVRISRAAKSVCAQCDVRAQCLSYALEHHETYGIWGGRTSTERRELNRRHTQ